MVRDRCHRRLDSVAGKIDPLQKVSDFVSPNTERDFQHFQTADFLAECRIKTRASLFDISKVERRSVGDDLNVVGIPKICIGPGDGGAVGDVNGLRKGGAEVRIFCAAIACVPTGIDSHIHQVCETANLAGSGCLAVSLAYELPHADVFATDISAPALEIARENAVKAGVAQRFHTIPGSAFDVAYGGPYDIVLLTNFLHHFDPPTCTGLLQKVHAALKPGGRAATLEFVPNEDRISPPMAAAFSLTMLASTASGDAYTFRELEAMYREAGFGGITAHPIPHSAHTVVMGRVSV